MGRPLDMEKTLEENGIEDEDPEFDRLDVINANWYIPVIHLFFSDDLTVAWSAKSLIIANLSLLSIKYD